MTFFFFFFDNDIEFFTTTSIQKQTGQTQVKSSSFIRALNDYKKEESEKKKFQGVFGIQVILTLLVSKTYPSWKNLKVP